LGSGIQCLQCVWDAVGVAGVEAMHQRPGFTWAMLPWLFSQALGQSSVYGPDYIPPNPNHTLPIWLDPPKFAEAATCVVDISLATIFLGHAGMSLNAAVQTCQRINSTEVVANEARTSEAKASCTASVAGVVTAFSYAAGFLAEAASDCKSSMQIVNIEAVKEAACAADIATFLASLGLLANSAVGASETCRGRLPDAVDRLADNTRRLYDTEPLQNSPAAGTASQDLQNQQLNNILEHKITSPFEAKNKTLHERSGEIAMCFFDVGQATFFMARAGLMINAAVADCSRFELRTGGKHAKARCAVDVRKVIASFSFVASGISYASFHCPFWKTVAPACAGAIANLIAALSEIAAVSASFQATCGYEESHDQDVEARLV